MSTDNIPTTIENVYVYVLNDDGTVSALDDYNQAVTITGDDGGSGVTSYTDSAGRFLFNVETTELGAYQSQNGFITYDSSTGKRILVSNDIIETPSAVTWSGLDTSTITLTNTSSETTVNQTLDYTAVEGGSTGDGTYDTSTHVEMPCFLAGTLILTKNGYKSVETLNLQDQIATITKGTVVWSAIKALAVGNHKIYQSPFADRAGYPIRIKKDAISPGMPFKDLLVTHDHALYIDNKLFLARTLVDGEKIFFDKEITEYNFYHVDLHDHVIIEADGLQVESYNSKAHKTIFGSLKIEENVIFDLGREPKQLQVCNDPVIIQAIREKIGLKKDVAGIKNNKGISFNLTDNTDNKIAKRRIKENLYSFTLAPGVNEVQITSDVSRPYDYVGPHLDDRRELGVLVEQVTLVERTDLSTQKEHLQKKSLKGWSALENPNCRWTAGNAVIHLERKNPEKQAVLLIKFLNAVS